MISTKEMLWRGAALCAALALTACTGLAQGGQAQPDQPKQQPGQATEQKKPQDQSLQLEIPNAPTTPVVSVEEGAAFQAFQQTAESEKKVQAGETFLQKYPQSRYRRAVYSELTIQYFMMGGQTGKLLDAGKNAIELNPSDVNALAIMGQTMARLWHPTNPAAAQELDTAEAYSKRAIEVLPTLVKPAELTEEAFHQTMKSLLSMAHSGLGLVDLQRKKYTEAVSELEESLKDVSPPDPVNYYLLGFADQQIGNRDEAAAAYTKCGDIPWSLQERCKRLGAEAKKLGIPQPSAPK